MLALEFVCQRASRVTQELRHQFHSDFHTMSYDQVITDEVLPLCMITLRLS